MTSDIEASERPRLSLTGPDQVDRVLIAACVVIWLLALGSMVAAAVALVGLANGRSIAAAQADTPWLLYTIIGVSAAVIVGAIPLLIRARRQSSDTSAVAVAGAGPTTRTGDAGAPAMWMEPFGAPVLGRVPIPAASSRVGFPVAAVDRVWRRCTTVTVGAMGAAITGIGVATYLLASDHSTAAWILFGVAGVITVVTPAVPWFFLRELHSVLNRRPQATT